MIGLTEFLIVLGAASPALALWIAVIVFAAVRLRRGGGRAERFLLAGGIVKLAASLLSLPSAFIVAWLAGRGENIARMNDIYAVYGFSLKIIAAAGIICLICAFWVKFKERNTGAAPQAAAPES